MRLFRTLTISIIVSLLIHLLGAVTLSLIEPTLAPLSSKREQTTFVELMETPENSNQTQFDQNRSIVRQTDVPPEMLTEKERKARFYSERDQTVLEEQRARDSGLTANRSGTNPQSEDAGLDTQKPQARAKRPLDLSPKSPLEIIPNELKSKVVENREPGRAEKLAHESEGDIAVGGLAKKPSHEEANNRAPADGSKPLALPNLPGKTGGASTVGEQLPSDIKFGNFTALNTDRYLYYSFYARVEELVRHRWVKYVRATLYSYQNSATHLSGSESWTTQVEIVLDKEGNFQKAILHNSSGLKGLDTAPVQAFREAKQIPNPPSEMVKTDGTIRLMYEFNVNFVPQIAAGG